MKYAVIQLAGKQYKVAEGEKFTVNRLANDVDKTFDVSDVLLIADGEKVTLGAPLIEKAVVKLKVVEHNRADKIRVATYRAKSKTRNVRGHRQLESVVEVVSIK
jgi:large subunit ribosomal protein L21